jgi:hypothetical protein
MNKKLDAIESQCDAFADIVNKNIQSRFEKLEVERDIDNVNHVNLKILTVLSKRLDAVDKELHNLTEQILSLAQSVMYLMKNK